MFKNYNKRQGYKLSDGDIIKFGRVRFRVKAVSSKRSVRSRLENYDNSMDVSMNEKLIRRYSHRRKSKGETENSFDSLAVQKLSKHKSVEQESINDRVDKLITESGKQEFNKIRKEAVCRICLGSEEDEEISLNPLISPCKCNGTMQYIHLECLKQWLESKIHTKFTEFTYSYNWKNLV